MSAVLSILYRHLKVFRRTWLTNLIFNFAEPFLYLTALGVGLGALVQGVGELSYIQFIAPGMVASAAMWAATNECTYASYVRLNFQKTFHAMLAAPVTIRDVVAAEVIFGLLKSVIYGTVILVVIWGWGLVPSWWGLLIPVVLILPGVTFSLMALSYTGVTTHIDYMGYYVILVTTPFYLFSGIFFPIVGLPDWALALAWVNPLYHTVEICRALAIGKVSAGLWANAATLAAMAGGFYFLPVALFRKRLIQ
ncbi:MAG: ABC transporter permease [Negativicutes bacterium]|nr:ABC transporter permease [Negativicutes bacterium]